MVKNIVLIGGAGAPNYGDELIVKGWISFFKSRNLGDSITFYENIAKNEEKLHGKHKDIRFHDDLVKVAKNYSGIGFWEQVVRGYRFIDNNGFEKYSRYNLKPLLRADVVHLHGGGYLNNFDPEKGFYIGLLAALKVKYGIKVFATGIGFGPVPKISEDKVGLVNEVFSKFSFFELRDVDNYRELKRRFASGNFIYGLDDCYLFKNYELVHPRHDGKKRLYLSFLSYNLDKVSEKYWEELRVFSEGFDEILFIESYPWQDKEVFSFLSRKLPNVKNLSVDWSLNRSLMVGPEDYAICARFHVHYVLSRNNVVGVYSRDSKYYDVKHQSILDRGSNMVFSNFSDPNFEEQRNSDSWIYLQDNCMHQMKISFSEFLYEL